jgi:hypothetical protein
MNRSRRVAEFTDGTSQTLMAAEVKATQASANCHAALSLIQDPNNIPSPAANPLAVAPEYNTCAKNPLSFEFHTEWSAWMT